MCYPNIVDCFCGTLYKELERWFGKSGHVTAHPQLLYITQYYGSWVLTREILVDRVKLTSNISFA